ncbi:hypothetical protein ACH4VX_15170 [Streptomyces sp. NPDC020731]|uniref:hypothetical protein n=1 Tax=Streptomyces sp. NPDC020731 TaxID=3365085 RepID=UPI00379B56D9
MSDTAANMHDAGIRDASGGRMAESVEHKFLSETALDIMEGSTNARLFNCKESGRKRFDFSCNLTRDWTRAISGQTLWMHNRDGIDKDIRTLLTDDEASATVYVARDAVATRGRVDEIIRDYRNSPLRPHLAKLRIFWVPADFTADDEQARAVVRDGLRHDIYQDLLLRVALGGITAEDVRKFASSGNLGYPVWILNQISQEGYFDNYTRASKRYMIGIPTLKQEILRLELTGMVSREGNAHGLIRVTEKGQAMLDISARLHRHLSGDSKETEEFLYICKLLDVDFSTLTDSDREANFTLYEGNEKNIPFGHHASNTELMFACLFYASQHGEIRWSRQRFVLPGFESSES